MNALRLFHRDDPDLGSGTRDISLQRVLTGQAEKLVADYLRDAGAAAGAAWNIQPAALDGGRAILDAEPALQVAVIRVAMARALRRTRWSDSAAEDGWRLSPLLSQLFRRRQPYTTEDVCALLRLLAVSEQPWMSMPISLQGLLRSVERHVAGHGMTPEIAEALEALRRTRPRHELDAPGRKALALLDDMLGRRPPPRDCVEPGDAWGAAALESLRSMSPIERAAWQGVLDVAAEARGAWPSVKWSKSARQRIDTAAPEVFTRLAVAWLALLGRLPRAATYRQVGEYRLPENLMVLTESNSTLVRGLVWCCALFDDPTLARAVADAAEECFFKIPWIGMRSQKIGNACVRALGAMPGMAGVLQLGRLRYRVKQDSARALVEATLEAAAARLGLSRDDLDDLAVPSHGLTDGRLLTEVGGCVAEIAVAGPSDVTLRWRKGDGTPSRVVPAAVRRDHAEAVQDLRRAANDIQKSLAAQRTRLERLYLTERSWPLRDWRERYLEHPLLSLLTRRLIWWFEAAGRVEAGAWHDGRIVDAEDRPLVWLTEGARVRLWHPLGCEVEAVLAWRGWLERHGMTQPFKQAHREIYVLTDAELHTGTYSNRFAAHILRQHVFSALCRTRGWRYGLQGGFDGGSNAASFALPRWNLEAAYWVDGADEGPLSAMGVALYVATDQVRFRRPNGREIPLTEVPALAFSEVLRDVDLFVGVCSVGNDPTWRDAGPAGHREYWHSFAFGDLSASAQTRQAVLERLIPRLNIADRCRLTDRFLVVRGDLRTYKIHLGSGNILMEPNDQYLCIVPDRKGGATDDANVFLPFEGDGVLAIILSKAFLLADDRAITDPTITRQIG